MTRPQYAWQSKSYKDATFAFKGVAATLVEAKALAENARARIGRDAITKVTGPRGGVYVLRAKDRVSGLTWERQ